MVKIFIYYFFLVSLISTEVLSNNNRLIIASTTSTYDTGFLEYINNNFKKKFNIDVHVIALGTGQAVEIAKRGDVDILLVHYKPLEKEFMDNGYGIVRYDLMYNDYVVVGPKNTKIKCNSIENFFNLIEKEDLFFISRADKSGTNYKELELWNLANIKPNESLNNYLEIGQGMGPTLMMANELKGYTLTDRATWIKYNNKLNLDIICENHPPLINNYGIIAVNPKLNKNVNLKLSLKYINWIISKEGSFLINNFKINGKQLFFYNYE